MKPFTVSLFGNRVVKDPVRIEERLEKVVLELLRKKEYAEFLVGRSGAFDLLAASVIRRCREHLREDNSTLVLVLPYETAEYRKNRSAFEEYYGEIEICSASASEHYKKVYRIRNDEMLARADLVIFCAAETAGNTWNTLRRAEKMGKPFVNLAVG